MLIVTGIIEVHPDKIGPARAAAIQMMQATRKEQGCHVYEFSQLVETPNRFRVYEEWEDAAALKAHGETAHMAAFREALGEIGVVSRKIETIQVGARSQL
ncbi:antibiotic biosynthesis monooxygenase [Rhodobacteraceae bacterium F11138]|nr:antibiotic biosynthesis monooxygenase [Rhodobacteraceae bacterium F11138]